MNSLRILAAVLVATFCITVFVPTAAMALEREEIQALNFLVINSRDEEVKAAWTVLQENGVIKVRPEKQHELSLMYPKERSPEVADALVLLTERNVLSPRPLNWSGSDNAIEILVDKEEVFPRAIEMMDRAKLSIRFNMFLWGGKIGLETVEAMKRAIARGVSVQVITMPDSENTKILAAIQKLSNKIAGDEPLPPYAPIKAEAVAAGINVAYFPTKDLNGSAIVKADHNKVITIDGLEALTGGMNFADAVANNHDLMLWIKGPAVRELEEVFADNWRVCRKENAEEQAVSPLWNDDRILDAAVEKPARDLATVTVCYSNSVVNATRGMVESLVDNAQHKLRIMMFTFTDDVLVRKTIEAHKRGVDVKVILDPNVHAFGLRLMGAPNISTVQQFKRAGIEVKAYKTRPGSQMHIKAMMVDDKYCCFGSTNFTKAGFDSNNETFVKVESKYTAADLEALFDLDWADYSYVLESQGVGKWFLGKVTEMIDGAF